MALSKTSALVAFRPEPRKVIKCYYRLLSLLTKHCIIFDSKLPLCHCTVGLLLNVGFTKDTKTTVIHVIKNCRKPCSTISFICKNRPNLIDLTPLQIGNPAFQTLNFVTSEKDDFVKFLAKYAKRCSIIIEHCIAYSASNIAKSSFSDVTKLWNVGLPMVWCQTD